MRAPRRALRSARAAPTPCCRAAAWSRGCTRWTEPWRRSRRDSACTGCSSPRCRQGLPDLLREHEPHVLLDDLELRHVLGPACAEELHQSLHQLLGRARARADPHYALVAKPLVAYLGLVVDQVRLGAMVARHLDEAARVSRGLRAAHPHHIAHASPL